MSFILYWFGGPWVKTRITLLRWAVLIFPGFCHLWYRLGHWLTENNRYPDALTCLHRALEKGCETAQIHVDLATVYAASHRFLAAERSLRRALELEPSDPTHWMKLGIVLSLREHREQAIHALQKAIHLKPDHVESLFHLAKIHLDSTDADVQQSENLCRQALGIDPNHKGSQTYLARALALLGRMDEAAALYEQILTHSPADTVALGNLAEMGRLSPEKIHQGPTAISTGNPYTLAYDHFSLAQIHRQNKDYEKAFDHYRQGNFIIRQSYLYDVGLDALVAQRIQTVFNSQFFSQRHGWGDPSNKPIFILGMPRSGTTLVEQILASHPCCHGGGERNEIVELVSTMGILSHTNQAFPEATSELEADDVQILGQSYVQSLTLLNPHSPHITDKLPHNFLYVGLIHLLLPNARIIHCRRHPMDTCLSCYQQLFSGFHPYAYDLQELGRYYRMYYHLMDHWQKTLPGRILDVHYEQVVHHPEEMIRRILDHCHLPWDARCLDFHKVERMVDTASFIEVRRPLYQTSVGRWHLLEEQLKPLRQALGDLLPDAGMT